MGVSGGTNNGKDGGSSDADLTDATLSPKNEPQAGTEKVLLTHL